MASLDTLLVMALKDESQGLFEKAGFNPFYCGMGLVKAAHFLTRRIAEHPPKQIINLGTAGSRNYPVGSLVECTSFIQRVPHDYLPIPSTAINVKPLTTLPPVRCGSGDFVERSEAVTQCDVFDMEAYALALVCTELGVPFNSIKFITDQSDHNTRQDWKKNLFTSATELLLYYREMPTIKDRVR